MAKRLALLLLLLAAPAWAATPTYFGHGTVSEDITAAPWSVTPTLPTSWAADDIHVAMVLVAAGDGTLTPPGGWTLIKAATGGTGAQIWFYWRRAVGGDSDPTFSLSAGGANLMAAEIQSIRGADTSTTPFEDDTLVDSTSATDTTPDTAEITTTGTNRLAVSFAIIEDNTAWSVSPPPSGWTVDRDQPSPTGTDYRLLMISKEETAATTVSAVAFGTLNAGEYYASVTLAFFGPTSSTRRVLVIE